MVSNPDNKIYRDEFEWTEKQWTEKLGDPKNYGYNPLIDDEKERGVKKDTTPLDPKITEQRHRNRKYPGLQSQSPD